MKPMKQTLHDVMDEVDEERTIDVEVTSNSNGISVKIDGYEDMNGCDPVLIELYEGVPRVVIWGDINQEDPTHIILLEGARTTERCSCPYGKGVEAECTPLRASDCGSAYKCGKRT